MNDKPRSNSILNSLPPEQQAQIKHWLFEKNLSLDQIVERCQKEFKLTVSKSSVARYHRREKSLRRLDRLIHGGGGREASVFASRKDDPKATDGCYADLVTTTAQMAQESARGERDEDHRRAFVECMKLLISARREGNYARRVDLAREKFEFDAATAVVARLLQIQTIVEDESLSDEEVIRSVREELFGPNLPA